MNILIIAPLSGTTGGIQRWANHIKDYYLENKGDECTVEFVDFSRSRNRQSVSNYLFQILYAFWDYIHLIYNVSKAIEKYSGDIIHITTPASFLLIKDWLFIKVAHRSGKKAIIHFHFGRIPELYVKKNWEYKLLKMVVQSADSVIVIDEKSYNVLVSSGFSKIMLLPNPLSPRVADIIAKRTDLKPISFKLLFAGYVIATKGVYELVDACKELPGVKLKLLGAVSRNMKQELYNRIGENKHWLEIAGEQAYEATIEEMLTCDIFILPTYTEGFPNVILESMACGCAIVTTAVGAIPEMLEEENGNCYGLMVEPQDTVQLKTAIEKMLADEVLKEKCRCNVRKRVNERYNISSVWKQMSNIWMETLYIE